jgi:pimeloyl-ACP methyl ester carboxylesterase
MPIAELNDHTMYYEILGEGPAVVCSGGWGTWCHGGERHLPAGLTERFKVIIFDHRGIGQSDDRTAVDASTALYARDVLALLDHLSIESAHFLGIVGIGACIGQELALIAPRRVRSLVNSGTWARADDHFRAKLKLWLELHEQLGFEAFQRCVVLSAFDAAFFNRYQDKLLGPNGGWSDLQHNLGTHQRLTEAALGHDCVDRLGEITTPTLVFHASHDEITPPHLSKVVEQGITAAQGKWLSDTGHVITQREQREYFSKCIISWLEQH